jgi:hypothetical protein
MLVLLLMIWLMVMVRLIGVKLLAVVIATKVAVAVKWIALAFSLLCQY